MYKIINHRDMKNGNLSLILRSVFEKRLVSRKALQARTNLSWGTVTSLTKELFKTGVLKEISSVKTGVGRRPVEIDFDLDNNLCLGLRLGSTGVQALLTDIRGSIIGNLKIGVSANDPKEIIVNKLRNAADNLLTKCRVASSKLAGIGIAVPGIFDPDRQICVSSPRLPFWRDVPLKKLLAPYFDVPCFIDHCTNCAALAEKCVGHGRGVDNFLCVFIGSGIAVGIVIDGKIYQGINGASGELGHICIDPDGPECACGKKGCLESYVSGKAMARIGKEAVLRNKDSQILSLAENRIESITGENVYSAAKSGDKTALKIFNDMGHYLGMGISILINLFNPQCVIIAGRVSSASEFFMPALQETLAQRVWKGARVEIRISQLNNIFALGAAGLVMEEFYSGNLLVKRTKLPAKTAESG